MNAKEVLTMSAKDSIHYPHHVDIKEFIKDYCDKSISATKMQKKYEISPRQYRLVTRHMRETYNEKPRYYKSPKRRYIYRNMYGLYVVRKRIDGVFKYFGTYETLDKAISIRDKLVENNWDKSIIGG